MNGGCARPSTYSTVLRDVRAFVGGRDINHNDANLLPRLNVTVSVGDLIERISSIDDRAKLTRLHAGFQELDKCVAAAAGGRGTRTLLFFAIDDQTISGRYCPQGATTVAINFHVASSARRQLTKLASPTPSM